MKSTSVSVAEGKKGFSRLINDALEKKEEIVVTKRGKPVAVIIPYAEYQHSKRIEGYKKIMEARRVFLKANISADETYKESRRQLEGRS
ncbi:MAG: type II toxin-antitoxin system Phd/YefM family antitoxin [Deltaproteobacteria bacterium]|nr:type II toxin-antitoxin system Phd/YefM family antitoxin [Deltaproteobacteria bacterium]